MKIDKRLNLVLQVEREDESVLHVHSVPIPHAVFETYFLVMAQTWTALMAGGVGTPSGPRVAAMMLKRIATAEGEWEGPTGVEAGLLGEIRRLTNVMLPTASGGWETRPLDMAIEAGALDDEDLSSVLNAVVFFTLASHVPHKRDRKMFLDGIGRFWGGLVTPSNSTEYTASLQISTQDGSSGAKATAQSIPT